VKLPPGLLSVHFQASFKRGTIIRFLMTDPDDPHVESRHKFALVIGIDPESPESFLLLTTSKIDKYEVMRRRLPEGFHEFSVEDYSWVAKPTLLDMRKVRGYSKDELVQKMNDGCLTFECVLSEDDMRAIDVKLKASRTIELKTLRKIVAGIS
jgi:hypothetical protein